MTKELANRLGLIVLLLIFLVLIGALFASVPQHPDVMAQQVVLYGDPSKAPQEMIGYGCGSCHVIPGVPGANGMSGPRLSDIASRSFLAGMLPNTPDNLVLWIQHPQQVQPGVDMPDLGVSTADARDIAAYLYKLH